MTDATGALASAGDLLSTLPLATEQNAESFFQPIAATPHGETKGENPEPFNGSRYNTDLPGSWPDATVIYRGLVSLAGDDPSNNFPLALRPDVVMRSESGVMLRIGSDLNPRIDIPANVLDLSRPETIHFKGGEGDICPTP